MQLIKLSSACLIASYMILGGLSIAPTWATTNGVDSAQLIKDGETAAAQNDWQKAYDLLSKACEQNEQNVVALYDLGIVYLHMGNPEKAKEMEEKAISLQPDCANAYVQLGAIYAKLGQMEEAEGSLVKALNIEPDNTLAKQSLEAIRATKGNSIRSLPAPPIIPIEAAGAPVPKIGIENTVSKLPEPHPEDEINYLLKNAKSAFSTNNLTKARDLLNRVITLDPRNSMAYSGLGAIAGAKANYNEEIALEDKAISFDANNPNAHFNLAWALARQEKWQAALQEYNQVLKLAPEAEEAKLGKAIVCAQIGQYDEATKILEDLNSKNPSSYSVHLAKSFVFDKTNKTDLAESEIKQSLELAPHQLETRLRMACYYLKTGRWQEANKAYAQLAKEFPDNEQVWLGLGLSLAKTKEASVSSAEPVPFSKKASAFCESTCAFQKACSIDPANASAHLALGMAHIASGRKEIAYDEINQAKQELKPKYELASSESQLIQ